MIRACGVVLLDKPTGISSFKALAPVKRALRGSKVGHTGTLDPFASGLLVALVGPLTRFAPTLTGFDKSYEAVLSFGAETDTCDPTGTVVAQRMVPSLEEIEAAVPLFRGPITQTPPKFSAVHVAGRRAYERARAGEEVAIPPRDVTVRTLVVKQWDPPLLTLALECSSGTYVRSIARDLGVACGSAAHCHSLRRTAVGDFRVDASVTPERFTPEKNLYPPQWLFDRLPAVGRITVDAATTQHIRHGKPFPAPAAAEALTETVAVFGPGEELIAVVDRAGDRYEYRFVVPSG